MSKPFFQPTDVLLTNYMDNRPEQTSRKLVKVALALQFLAMLVILIWGATLSSHLGKDSYSNEEMAGVVTTMALAFPFVLAGAAAILTPAIFSLMAALSLDKRVVLKTLLMLVGFSDLILFLLAMAFLLKADAEGCLALLAFELLAKAISLPILILAIIRLKSRRIFP